MRPRLTVTKRLGDGFYVSQTVRPNIPKPHAGGMILAFVLGAVLFIVCGLIFVAVFAP